jgi:tRNA(Ile)-lysidine synthase
MASSRNSVPADGRGRSRHACLPADVPAPSSRSRGARGDSCSGAGNTTGDANGEPVDGLRNSPLSPVLAAIAAALREFVAPGARIAIALSGGLDSMVLLDALAPFAAKHVFVLSAVHVDHGLSPNAERWAQFCAEQCAARGVPLTIARLELKREAGASLEALARTARYEQLNAAEADVVALAHHADDQAETVLLQLLRGAGPRGLSAMPRFHAGRPALLRPLLALTRSTLAAYAAARGLAWIDDESNAETRHRRNLLRHTVAPLLARHFPGYPATLVRAAAHQAEASILLDELAAHDGAGAYDVRGLERARLAALSPARARNLLRWFLRHEGLRPPSQTRLSEMLRQLIQAADDVQVSIGHAGREIGIHRGRIHIHASAPAAYVRPWHGEHELHLPGGTLVFDRVRGTGLCVERLLQAPVTLRSRVGGERMQLAANRPHHAVKKLLQQMGLPQWERGALPLLWCGDELAAIPGIGVAVTFQAARDAAGWELVWKPDAVVDPPGSRA